MTENWERWEPAQGLAKNYYVEKMLESSDGLCITLVESTTDKKILIDFGQSVKSYRSVYETFRSKLIVELEKKYGADFYAQWSFFKISNSDYLKWIDQESYEIASYGLTPELQLKHFCLLTMEAYIDIIAYKEPKVTFL